MEGSSNPTLTVFTTSPKDTLIRQGTISSRLERDNAVLPERTPPPATPFSHNPSPHSIFCASQPQLSRGSEASTAATRMAKPGSQLQQVFQKPVQGQQPMVGRFNGTGSLQGTNSQQTPTRVLLPTIGTGRNGRVRLLEPKGLLHLYA